LFPAYSSKTRVFIGDKWRALGDSNTRPSAS
jgi:hypothetical protein